MGHLRIQRPIARSRLEVGHRQSYTGHAYKRSSDGNQNYFNHHYSLVADEQYACQIMHALPPVKRLTGAQVLPVNVLMSLCVAGVHATTGCWPGSVEGFFSADQMKAAG